MTERQYPLYFFLSQIYITEYVSIIQKTVGFLYEKSYILDSKKGINAGYKEIFMKRAKKIVSILLCAVCMVLAAGAEDYLNANDLEPVSVTAKTQIDGIFSIYANADKNVTVEVLPDAERTAADGEVFNNRIKLNGSGSVGYRSIHFITSGAADITVYTNSSSKTDARVLAVTRVSDGKVVAELKAPADGSEAGIATCKIPSAGEYAVFSKGSGINIYQIIIE